MNTNETTDSEADLRALGVQADATASDDFSDSQSEAVETTDASTTPEVEGQPPAGEEQSKPESPETGAENKDGAKPELSEYEKAKAAGREREAKAWQKIEEAKAELNRKAEELAERESKAAPVQPEAYRDKHGYSADDYERTAKEAEAGGDEDLARVARETAVAVRAEAQQVAAQSVAKSWLGTLTKAIESNPALADLKNQESPLAKEFMDFLKSSPVYGLHPSGAQIAAELFAARRQTASVSELKGQIEALTKKNKELTALTSIGGSKPVKQGGGAGADPSGEDLRRMAEAYDMSGAL